MTAQVFRAFFFFPRSERHSVLSSSQQSIRSSANDGSAKTCQAFPLPCPRLVCQVLPVLMAPLATFWHQPLPLTLLSLSAHVARLPTLLCATPPPAGSNRASGVGDEPQARAGVAPALMVSLAESPTRQQSKDKYKIRPGALLFSVPN